MAANRRHPSLFVTEDMGCQHLNTVKGTIVPENKYRKINSMSTYVLAQNGGSVRLEWGRRGANLAAQRGDVLVIVDVLSFSSAVVTAVQQARWSILA